MRNTILLFLAISFLMGCSSSNYEEFIGTWKNQRTIGTTERIIMEEADDNQLRLRTENQYTGHSMHMVMEFKDKATIESTQDFFGVKSIYKLKEEDGAKILVDYTTNDKFNKID